LPVGSFGRYRHVRAEQGGFVRRCPTCQAHYSGEAKVCPIDGSALEDAPDPLIGRTIGGRYLVCELIGTGGMGTVYRGRHQLVGRDVALKFLAPRYARDAGARERFLREARAANRIDHEHIIDITDFGETSDNLVFLVMEYLDGETLSQVIERGALAPDRALAIAHQLATALARAHELDVIHRDIKPDNVFVLQRRGVDFVKLLDFGLAKVVGEHRLTATGKIFGTPEYLAPEQARGEPLSGHADQYSLGCVMYEMLTGHLPFEGPHPEVVIRHLQAQAIPPSQRRKGLPFAVEIDALIARMLEKQPADRFTDAYHLADELRQLIEQMSGGRSSRPPRRSGTMSVQPPLSQTQEWLDAAEENWAQRFEHFSSLLPRAYPGVPVPEGTRVALLEMSALVTRARALRRQLGDNVLRAKEQEDNLRTARLRVGHAADELGRDESRVVRRIIETQAARDQAEAHLREVEVPIAAGLSVLRKESAEPRAAVNHRSAELLRQLGGHASLWLEAEAQLAPLSARLSTAEREREDLRFQIAQLKGRLGILNVDADATFGTLREQADQLEAELENSLDSLTCKAEAVAQIFTAIPGMRELLPTARISAPPRESAGRG
jgi:eukaryotic-like serine/threonine-protein kinase